jgi:4-amino-4-deoxy-L-arabinose transferase-like glycosyltransferase
MFLSSIYVITEFSLILNLDTLFAFFIIPLFYLNYRLAEKGKFYTMFIAGYLLTSLAFMTKGFPALWFQGVSLILALYFTKNLRKLFTLQHLSGIFSFMVLPILFFTLHSGFLGSKLYISRLIEETLIAQNFSFSHIIMHLIAFPFLNIQAYLPMALLLPALLLRRNIVLILKNKELSYLLFICIAGCSVFAISPYYPRYYCLMFVPLVFDIITYLIPNMQNLNIKEKTGAIVWNSLFAIAALPLLRFNDGLMILIIVSVSVLIWIINKMRINIIIAISLILIIIKLSYPLHELKNKQFGYETKEQCQEIVLANKDKDLYILEGSKKVNYVSIFYLTYFSGEVIHYSKPTNNTDAIYITDLENLPDNAIVTDTIDQTFWGYDENARLKGKNFYSPIFVIRYDSLLQQH